MMKLVRNIVVMAFHEPTKSSLAFLGGKLRKKSETTCNQIAVVKLYQKMEPCQVKRRVLAQMDIITSSNFAV